MKRWYCLYLLLLPCTMLNAQPGRKVRDSVDYYMQKIVKINKTYRDSMFHDPEFKSAQARLNSLKAASDNYNAFVIYTQVSSADFDKLNTDNKAAGFGNFSGQSWGVGIGFSSKRKRRMFNLNVATFGIGKKVKKADENIKINYSNMFQLEWGYDFVKSRKVNIYPYAGLGFRDVTLKYNAPVQNNPSPTYINNAVITNKSVEDDNTNIGYQAGIGFEFVISKEHNETAAGTLVFIKAGTNRSFGKKTFDMSGFRYDPKFNYGAWNITVGFKFFGR